MERIAEKGKIAKTGFGKSDIAFPENAVVFNVPEGDPLTSTESSVYTLLLWECHNLKLEIKRLQKENKDKLASAEDVKKNLIMDLVTIEFEKSMEQEKNELLKAENKELRSKLGMGEKNKTLLKRLLFRK